MPTFTPASGAPTNIGNIAAIIAPGNFNLNYYRGRTYYRNGVGMITVPSTPIGINDLHSLADYYYYDLVINSPQANFNLYTWLTTYAGWDGSRRIVARLTNNSTIYATSTGSYALTISGFPSGSEITFTNYGTVLGCGGFGGNSSPAGGGTANNGGSGGHAMLTESPVTIYNYGNIWAGGGGGGGGGSAGSLFGGFYGTMGGGGGGGGYSYQTVAGGAAVAANGWGGSWVNMSNGANGGDGGGFANGAGGGGGSWVGNAGAGGAGGGPGVSGSAGGGGAGNLVNYGGGSGGDHGYYSIGYGYITWGAYGDLRGYAG